MPGSSGARGLRRWWSKWSRPQQATILVAVIGAAGAVLGPLLPALVTSPLSNASPVPPPRNTRSASPSSSADPAITPRPHIIGYSSSSTSLISSQLAVAESSRYYRLSLPLTNTLADDQVVARIALDVFRKSIGNCGGGPSGDQFTLKGKLGLVKNTGTARAAISGGPGLGAGFTVPTVGTWGSAIDCAWWNLSLSFSPPALVLPGSKTTTVVIDIPKEIRAVTDTSPQLKYRTVRMHSKVSLPDLVNPTSRDYPSTYYLMFIVRVQLNSGATTSACRQLRGDMWTSADKRPGCLS